MTERQAESEATAAAVARGVFEVAAMHPGDAARQGEAEARTWNPAGEGIIGPNEFIEDAIRERGRDTWPPIEDLHQRPAALLCDTHGDFTA